LLDQFGVDWFNDSGMLQLAVKNHDMETVKMLVEAGADINELVTDWQTDIREHRAAPLSALHEAMYGKSEKMIRYLAEHGAKLTLRDLHIPDTYNVLRKEFRPFADLIVELGAVQEETSL
jgi:ankyrin repeat protein